MPSISPRIIAVVASRVLFGQERANILVLEELRATGCEVLAIVEDHPDFPAIAAELTARNIPFVASPVVGRRYPGFLLDFLFGNPIRYLKANQLMADLIRQFQPTHFHIPNPFYFLTFMHALNGRIPIIYRIGDRPSAHNIFFRWLWRHIVRRVDHFVANSTFIAEDLKNLGIPDDRITVIYNAPTRRAKPPTPTHQPTNNKHFTFIGQLTADKGIDILLEAFAIVAAEFPSARLTIASGLFDAWSQRLRDRVLNDPELTERVRFAGDVEDVYELLASSSFLVVPSVWEEPFANVVIEAKAAARPAVIFPSGGLPEAIQHEHDGYQCSERSPAALADGLRYYLSDADRARRHGQAAFASLKRLGIDQFGLRWRAVYDATLGGRRVESTRPVSLQKLIR